MSPFDLALGQQIQNHGAAGTHRGAMPRARSIHQPARSMAVELGFRRHRHDHVDFPGGMTMMVTDEVGDIDHVHAESMRRLTGLENAAEASLCIALATHPAGGDAGVAGLAHPLKRFALGRKFQVEFALERRVECAALGETRKRRDQLLKLHRCCHDTPLGPVADRRCAQAASARPAFTLSIQAIAHSAASSSGMVPALASWRNTSPKRRAPSSVSSSSKRLPPLQKVSAYVRSPSAITPYSTLDRSGRALCSDAYRALALSGTSP